MRRQSVGDADHADFIAVWSSGFNERDDQQLRTALLQLTVEYSPVIFVTDTYYYDVYIDRQTKCHGESRGDDGS